MQVYFANADTTHLWAGILHSDLLPRCNRFQREFVPGHEKGADVREQHENEHSHQSMLVNGAFGRKRSGTQMPDFHSQATF